MTRRFLHASSPTQSVDARQRRARFQIMVLKKKEAGAEGRIDTLNSWGVGSGKERVACMDGGSPARSQGRLSSSLEDRTGMTERTTSMLAKKKNRRRVLVGAP